MDQDIHAQDAHHDKIHELLLETFQDLIVQGDALPTASTGRKDSTASATVNDAHKASSACLQRQGQESDAKQVSTGNLETRGEATGPSDAPRRTS